MPKQPAVHPLIIKSCQLLDAVLESPEWDRLIDLRNFTIYSSMSCPLGQTGGKILPVAPHLRIPWRGYYQGMGYLDKFAVAHPDVLERIGLRYTQVTSAFECAVPFYYKRDQNTQWEVYLAWRRKTRDAESKSKGD